MRNRQAIRNWGRTYEFDLKADLAVALGTTKLRNILEEDVGVAPAGNLEVNNNVCFRRTGQSDREGSGRSRGTTSVGPSLADPLSIAEFIYGNKVQSQGQTGQSVFRDFKQCLS